MNEGIINQLIDDRYLIQERITAGGMAIVYKAIDQTNGETIALKLLQSSWAEHPDVIDRFLREANIMQGLKHPHIVGFIGTGKYEDRPYIAMDYLPGGSLSDLLKEVAHIKLQGTSRLLRQIANALDYAHGKGVVHRDLKPGNILLKNDKHAALTDFGIARVLEHTQITVFGQMPGTPQYMSPEQASGLVDDLDHLSDIYSLAVIAYLLSTGRLPFMGGEPMAIMNAHLTQIPPNPTEINPELPPAVDAVLLKALEKKKADRYQTAAEFVREYEKAIKDVPNLEVVIRVKKKTDSSPDGVIRTHIFSEEAEVLTHYATTSPIRRLSEDRGRGWLTIGIPMLMVIVGLAVALGASLFNQNNSAPEDEQTNVAIVVQDSQATLTQQALEQATFNATQTEGAQIVNSTAMQATVEQSTLNATQTEGAQIANNTATQSALNQQATSDALEQTSIAQELTTTAQFSVEITRTQEAVINITATREAVLAQRATFVQQAIETVNARETGVFITQTAVILQETQVAQAVASAQAQTPTGTSNSGSSSANITPTPVFYDNDVAGVIGDLLNPATLTSSRVDCAIFVPIYQFITVQLANEVPEFMAFDELLGQETMLSIIYQEFCLNPQTDQTRTDIVILPSEEAQRISDLRISLQEIDTGN